MIGDSVAITVVKIAGGGVRLGVEAPPEMSITREELAEMIGAEQAAEQQAVKSAAPSKPR